MKRLEITISEINAGVSLQEVNTEVKYFLVSLRLLKESTNTKINKLALSNDEIILPANQITILLQTSISYRKVVVCCSNLKNNA